MTHQDRDTHRADRAPREGLRRIIGRFTDRIGLTGKPSARDLVVKEFAQRWNGHFGRHPDEPGEGFSAMIAHSGWRIFVAAWETTAGRAPPQIGFDIRCVAASRSDFRFNLSNSNLVDTVKAFFGFKDIQLGVQELDDKLRIVASNESGIRKLLLDSMVGDSLAKLGTFELSLRGEANAPTSTLHLRHYGSISGEALDRFCRAYLQVIEQLHRDHHIT